MSLLWWLPMTTSSASNEALAPTGSFTMTNATFTTTGGYNNSNCYNFNGTSAYILSSQNFPISGDSSYSIAFWCYWDGDSWQNDYVGVVGFGTMTTLNGGFACLHNGYPDLDFWNQRYKANEPLSRKTWYHLAFVKEKSTGCSAHIYVNGMEVAGTETNAAVVPNIIPGKVVIGRLNDSATRYFNGKICDIRIYDHALSAEDVQNLYSPAPSGIYVKVNNSIKKAQTVYVKVGGAWKQITLNGRSVDILNGNL